MHGMQARLVYDDLYKILQPQRTGGVELLVLAKEVQHRYRVAVQTSRHVDLHQVLGFGRHGALTIGVRPEHLYTGVAPGSLHAVYVAATEHPLDGVPDLPKEWQPGLSFTPPPDIIDPCPRAPARHIWTTEDLQLAYTGDWLLVPAPTRKS